MADTLEILRTQFPEGFSVYRVQDAWKLRHGVVVLRARRPWLRTWQAEWNDAPRAYRAWTRNGAIVRGVRAWRKSESET